MAEKMVISLEETIDELEGNISHTFVKLIEHLHE